MGLPDQLLTMLKELDSSLEFNYNRFYIGLSKDGLPYNFVSLNPKRKFLRLSVNLPQSDELDAKIEQAGIEDLEYEKRHGNYRLRLTRDTIQSQTPLLKELAHDAYERRSS
jgi:predicted transport protein